MCIRDRYKAVANAAVVTLDLAKAILNGDTIDETLITNSAWDFECSYDLSLIHI